MRFDQNDHSSSSTPNQQRQKHQNEKQQQEQQLMIIVEQMLQKEPSRMFSKEEILNLLAVHKKDAELEDLLAQLEVSSSLKEAGSNIHATCMGGTVYYKWNRG